MRIRNFRIFRFGTLGLLTRWRVGVQSLVLHYFVNGLLVLASVVQNKLAVMKPYREELIETLFLARLGPSFECVQQQLVSKILTELLPDPPYRIHPLFVPTRFPVFKTPDVVSREDRR